MTSPTRQRRAPATDDRPQGMALSPIAVLREATQKVPAVKWALAVAGVVAAVAIIVLFRIGVFAAVMGFALMIPAMVLMVLFAGIASTAKRHMRAPMLVILWLSVLTMLGTVACLFTSFFFDGPITRRELISMLGSPTPAVPTTQTIGDETKKQTEAPPTQPDHIRATTALETRWASNQKVVRFTLERHESGKQIPLGGKTVKILQRYKDGVPQLLGERVADINGTAEFDAPDTRTLPSGQWLILRFDGDDDDQECEKVLKMK